MFKPFTEEFIAERRAMLGDDPDAFHNLWEGEFKVDGERGSGRTSARLMTLNVDDIYVVGDWRARDYVWHLLHHLRPGLPVNKSNIWTVEDIRHDKLRSLGDRELVMDHAAWDRITDRQRAELDNWRSR